MSEPQGRVSALFYDRGYANYANLLSAGYRVDNATVPDSEAGTITIGTLEQRPSRNPTGQGKLLSA